MGNTCIYDENEELVNIIDFIHRELGENYQGEPEVIDCADYGIPEHRVRLLTVFSKTEKGKRYYDEHGTYLPPVTNSKNGISGTKPWKTLRDAIGDLTALRAEKGKNIDKANTLHKVPVLDEKNYGGWIIHLKVKRPLITNVLILSAAIRETGYMVQSIILRG